MKASSSARPSPCTRRPQGLAVLLVCLLSAAFLLASCGSGQRTDKLSGVPVDEEGRVTSPEIQKLDQRLDTIEGKTVTLQDRVDNLQGRVANKMGVPEADFMTPGLDTPLEVIIDHNSLIRVSGIVMNQSEFQNYLDKNEATICQPKPKVRQHMQANYERGAWVLEVMYIRCPEVDFGYLSEEEAQ